MSIYRTSVETVLYVGVPFSLFQELQAIFDISDANIDQPTEGFVWAMTQVEDPDETMDEILDNAENLGIDCMVVYSL